MRPYERRMSLSRVRLQVAFGEGCSSGGVLVHDCDTGFTDGKCGHHLADCFSGTAALFSLLPQLSSRAHAPKVHLDRPSCDP